MQFYSKIDPDKITPELKEYMTYEYHYWIRGRRGMRKKTAKKCMISKKGVFLSGFQKTVKGFTGVKFKNEPHKHKRLKLNRIRLEETQKRLLKQTIRHNRGVLNAPTGMGKTVIASSIISIFRDYKTVFICNTTDLLLQTIDEFNKILGINPNIISDGNFIHNDSNLTVAMSQSLKKHFDFLRHEEIVIVDECHEDTDENGRLWDFFHILKAKKIYGLTATLPNDKKRTLLLEGLIGPVIGKITYQEGIDSGRLSDVIVNIVKINSQPNQNLKWSVVRKKIVDGEEIKIRKYPILDWFLKNYERNERIRDIINKYKNDSFLITAIKIEHGKLIEKFLNESGIKAVFISGKDNKESRLKAKSQLEKKKNVVITTKIWNKGINIPNLDHVINAGGMKSEISTLQIAGRGTRKTDKKSVVNIWDFYDKGKYLRDHAKERINAYKKMQWVIKYKRRI
jgi:superfamily II DNA or RNA helicase